jgi:hypothetical protein
MGARPDASDEEDRVLTAVFLRREELRGTKHLAFEPTNRQLAKKYAVSPRTVTNWRKKGCPFDKGMIFNNTTVANLGVTPGTYVWTWGAGANQNFTLQIGSVGVRVSLMAARQSLCSVALCWAWLRCGES